MTISLRRARLSLLLTASLALAACGGDDGPDATTDPDAPPIAGNPAPPPSTGGSTQSPGTPDDPAPADPGKTPEDPPVAGNSKPTIAGTPQATVLQETPYVFVPDAADADGDILHFSIANPPPWAQFEPSTGRLHGTPTPADVGTYANITISVTDGADDAALEPFSITVTPVAAGAVELSWAAPTENVDGSQLTDLAGYKIYWGTQPNEFTNSVTIDNPAVVTYVLENLVPGTYYFVATALNSEGAESDPSDMSSVTIS